MGVGVLLFAVRVRATGIGATSPMTGSCLAKRVVACVAASGAVGLAVWTSVRFALIWRTSVSTMKWVAGVQAVAVANTGRVADRLAEYCANGVGASPIAARVIAHPPTFRVASERNRNYGK